ncbi:MAG: hypothetical protein RIF32_24050, partial [Leptospirales bacterium]
MWETIDQLWQSLVRLRESLDITLIELEGGAITIWTVVYVFVATSSLFFLTKRITSFITDRLFSRSSYDIGVRQAIGSIFRYIVVFIGLLVIVQSTGIDLTTLTVLAGAVGVGLGFGL